MITNTDPSDPPILGGTTIQTYVYRLSAFRLHQVLETAAMMAFGIIESKSNNTSNSISARDARNMQKGLDDIERAWEWAKNHRDDPTGVLEDTFEIQFPRPAELQLMPNVKLKQVGFELQNFFRVALGSQDSKHGIWIGAETEADVNTALATVKEIVTTLVGTGKDDNGSFNVGVSTANYSHVGRLSPPLTSPKIAHAEPSADALPDRYPDAPDRPSHVTGVSGGANTTNTTPSSGGASS